MTTCSVKRFFQVLIGTEKNWETHPTKQVPEEGQTTRHSHSSILERAAEEFSGSV
jgi:hypothetical protein